jgi:hypothetical protein
MLAEYNALKSEIQYRNEFQTKIISIHIIILTAIIGSVLYKHLNWSILLLIPIESSLFGLWYINYLLVI